MKSKNVFEFICGCNATLTPFDFSTKTVDNSVEKPIHNLFVIHNTEQQRPYTWISTGFSKRFP